MHFLDSGEGPDDEWARRHSAPENEVPVAVPVGRVLAHTAGAAVVLGRVEVSTGMAFTVGLRCRPEVLGAPGLTDVGDLLWSHTSPEPQLLVGVELADGRRASNLQDGHDPFGDRGPGADLVLAQTGGEGGQLSADQGWWLSPLPPAGPLRLSSAATRWGSRRP
jgi:hypothetical protein